MMVIGTFTRFCWDCKQNKVALGGKLDKRKMWHCVGCLKGEDMNWHKGEPPSIGWWPTKNTLNAHQGAYRWWNGRYWSWPAFSFESAAKAAHWASKQETKSITIEWADRPNDWPERSRL